MTVVSIEGLDRYCSWRGCDAAARQGNEVAAAKLKQLPAVDIGHAPFQLWAGRNVREEATAFRIVWGAQDELYPEAAGESDIGALGSGVIRTLSCHLGMLTARRDALFKGGDKPWGIG